MAIGQNPARESVRVRHGEIQRRAAAVMIRRTDRILNRRALGEKVEKIVEALNVDAYTVRSALMLSRRAGDPRALTDQQCNALLRRKSLRPDPALDAVAIEETLDAAEDRAAAQRIAAEPPHRDDKLIARFETVDRFRRVAEKCRTTQPNASAGFHHLADLYEHHATGYPSVRILSDGLTAVRIAPELTHSPSGSAAAACLDA